MSDSTKPIRHQGAMFVALIVSALAMLAVSPRMIARWWNEFAPVTWVRFTPLQVAGLYLLFTYYRARSTKHEDIELRHLVQPWAELLLTWAFVAYVRMVLA